MIFAGYLSRLSGEDGGGLSLPNIISLNSICCLRWNWNPVLFEMESKKTIDFGFWRLDRQERAGIVLWNLLPAEIISTSCRMKLWASISAHFNTYGPFVLHVHSLNKFILLPSILNRLFIQLRFIFIKADHNIKK